MTGGLLVVIEGIDGAGKTTLQHRLADALRAEGARVITTKEPTEGPLGKRIREIAASGRQGVPAEEEFRLFHEDRREHVQNVVHPALARNDVVIQDRSYFSSVAYQGERGLDREELLKKSREIAPDPDVLVIVDLPPDVALERIRTSRGGLADDFETLASLSKVREVFLGFEGALVLDGTRSADDLSDELRNAVLAALREKRRG